jgi:hypothetical protein
MVSLEFARMTNALFATALVMLKAHSARLPQLPVGVDISGGN